MIPAQTAAAVLMMSLHEQSYHASRLLLGVEVRHAAVQQSGRVIQTAHDSFHMAVVIYLLQGCESMYSLQRRSGRQGYLLHQLQRNKCSALDEAELSC